MRAALPRAGVPRLVRRFLPRLGRAQPATLFAPATVSDRSDGKIAHLDGLNLSRAWCWRALAPTLHAGDPGRRADARPQAHLDASLPPCQPATTWASTGSRVSRCWRWVREMRCNRRSLQLPALEHDR